MWGAEQITGTSVLPGEVLERLSTFDTPTTANAIETFGIRPRTDGFARPEIRAIFPELPVMVGYAVTGRIRSARPSTNQYSRRPWWEFVLSVPIPRVVVFEDLDEIPGVGAFWGEVNANIHRALGCVGVVTNGAVRDLAEARTIPFHYFAQHVVVSHAYVHLVDFGSTVTIGGLEVRTGELLHADRHGVLKVPTEIAPQIPEVARRLMDQERKVIEFCRSDDFSVDGLSQVTS